MFLNFFANILFPQELLLARANGGTLSWNILVNVFATMFPRLRGPLHQPRFRANDLALALSRNDVTF